MPDALRDAMRGVAASVLDTLGTAATITRSTESYNPETGAESGAASTDYSVNCSPPSPFKENEIDGTHIQRGDVKVLVAAKGLAIAPTSKTDTFTFDSVQYKIVDVDPIYSGSLPAAFELHCRK